MLGFMRSKVFQRVFSVVCFAGALFGIFLTSDKDISPLIPFAVALLPILISVFNTNTQVEHQSQVLENVQEQVVSSVNTSAVELVDVVQNLKESIQRLEAENRSLQQQVARLTTENRELRRAINTLSGNSSNGA